MDSFENVDQSGACLDRYLGLVYIEIQNAVHCADVQKYLAMAQGRVTVASARAAGANFQAMFATVCERLVAFINRGWSCDQGTSLDRTNQRVQVPPSDEAWRCRHSFVFSFLCLAMG